jgi:hypothetical protein
VPCRVRASGGAGTALLRIPYFSLLLFGAIAVVSMDCFLDPLVEFAFNLITEAFVKGVRSEVRDFREQKYDGFTLLRLTSPSREKLRSCI